ARRKRALRHGGNKQRLNIDEVEIAAPAPEEELLAISDALERFSTVDEPKAKLVKLRYFGGLTIEQAAPILGISRTTAKRWRAYARAWLYQQVRAPNSFSSRCNLQIGNDSQRSISHKEAN